MDIFLLNKPVYTFYSYCDFDTVVHDPSYRSIAWRYNCNKLIASDATLTELTAKINEKINTVSPKDGAVFLFDKSSKFPRFKLAETSYKRCIKKEKADFIVIKDFAIENQFFSKIIETEDKYYLFQSHAYFSGNYWNKYRKEYANLDNFIKKYKDTLFSSEIINSYNYNVFHTSTPDLLIDVLNGKTTNIITDQQLDKLITGGLDAINYNIFHQIKALIESSDKDSIGLGIRLLSNYNMEPMQASVNMLLGLNYNRIKMLPEWQSTATKQFRKNTDIRQTNFYSIGCISNYTKQKKHSDDDAKCCEEMFQDFVLKWTKSTQTAVNQIINDSDFKLTFKITFE